MFLSIPISPRDHNDWNFCENGTKPEQNRKNRTGSQKQNRINPVPDWFFKPDPVLVGMTIPVGHYPQENNWVPRLLARNPFIMFH